MTDVLFLREQLRKGYSDDPWHGPDTASLLADVTAEEAAAHPVAGAHSVWEIVLHMIAWQNEARQRLGGKRPGPPEEGDWPEPDEISPAAWRRDRERLGESLDELSRALAGCTEADLDRPGGSFSDRDPAPGTDDATYRGMVSGLLQHNAYHSGQLALLRKALRTGA